MMPLMNIGLASSITGGCESGWELTTRNRPKQLSWPLHSIDFMDGFRYPTYVNAHNITKEAYWYCPRSNCHNWRHGVRLVEDDYGDAERGYNVGNACKCPPFYVTRLQYRWETSNYWPAHEDACAPAACPEPTRWEHAYLRCKCPYGFRSEEGGQENMIWDDVMEVVALAPGTSEPCEGFEEMQRAARQRDWEREQLLRKRQEDAERRRLEALAPRPTPPPTPRPTLAPTASDRQTLGIPEEATLTSGLVTSAYKKMAVKWHPDKHVLNRITAVEATERFQEILSAKERLLRLCY